MNMNVTYDFSGKTALVVGGASGMGLATAKLLSKSGASVMVADFNREQGKKVVDELNDAGGSAAFAFCDVRDRDGVFSLIDETVEKFGRLDYAANVVGISGNAEQMPFYERPDKDYDNVMDTNMRGHWWLCQAETKQMTEQDGDGYAIVEVASIQGLVASGYGLHAYTASKHAAVGMIKSLGVEFAPKGIRINGIAPVATATPFVINAMKEAGMEYTNKTDRNPRGTLLEPEECANAIVWLISEGSSGVMATTIPVDAGATAFK